MSDEKKKNNENISSDNGKETLFESAYEKVLFIMNKVKDYIKKISSEETKLIEEIDWVIKVITNRSLYTMEIIKEKLIKQNEEYDKFINFVKKYNEEVIEMNKKHDIVTTILNLRKKEDILLKPSLVLTKIENINKVGEMPEKNKNTFVNTFGNYVLNLYEKNKKDANNENTLTKNNNIEENENTNTIESIHEIENKEHIGKNKKQMENKKKVNNTTNELLNYNLSNPKKLYLDNKNLPKQKGQNQKYKNKDNLKILNKNREFLRLTLAEKNNFNQMKQLMKNYYLNLHSNGSLMTNINQNLFKSYVFNNKRNNLLNYNIFKNKNSNEKTYNLYKTIRPNLSPYNMNYTSKNNFIHNNRYPPNLQTYNDTIEEIYDNNHNHNHNYKSSSNIPNNSKERNDKKKKTLNNKDGKNENYVSKNFEIVVKKRDKSMSLDTLLADNLNEFELITSIDFNIFELKKKVGYNNVLPLMAFIMLKALGLVDNKIITTKKLESFLRTVSDNYKITTLYHNCLHGADITQSLFVFFLNSNIEEMCETTVLDLLGLFLSALGHDLGHPGLNNGYHINAGTELGITYNDKSCLENFHSSYLFRILKKDENNIFEKFSVQNYKTIRKRMVAQILATDMAYHSEIMSSIRANIKTNKSQERFIFLSGNDKTKFDEQQLLLNVLIHLADLGHNCKKFHISSVWIKLLSEEFWMQGDKEREKGLPISFLCDRNNVDIPSSQIGFLKGFILPSYDCLIEMFPSLKFAIDNAEDNLKKWTQFQKEKRLTGWTPEKNKKKDKEEKGSDNK